MSKSSQAAKLAKQTELFDLYNKDDYGKIPISVIDECLRALGQQPTEEELSEIKERQSRNNIEQIELNEFSLMCFEQDRKEKEKPSQEEELRVAIQTVQSLSEPGEFKEGSRDASNLTMDSNVLMTLIERANLNKEELQEFKDRFVNKGSTGIDGRIDGAQLIEAFVYKEQQ